MASVLKERFILLKTVKFGDSDLIINALGKSGEKMGFMAKGARKSKKRFGGGVLQPTHFVELTYKTSQRHTELGKLHFLEDARLINGFNGLREDYDRLQMGLYFVHIFDKVSVEGAFESEYGFDLLGNALDTLQTSKDIQILKTQFELKFLHQQGVLPPALSYKEFLGRPLQQHGELSPLFPNEPGSEFSKLRSKLNHFIHDYIG